MSVPVIVLASLDAVLRDSATAALLTDLPGAVAVRHESPGPGGELRRVVSALDGIRSDEQVPLEHPCLSCATREDLVPTIERLVHGGARAIVVALPATADPVPLTAAVADDVPGARLAACVALVESSTLEDDLLGDDLLAERGLALGEGDRRSVGETLARQLECADVIATTAVPNERGRALLAHLVHTDTGRVALDTLLGGDLLARPGSHAPRRGDLRTVRATGAPPACGVWTVDLHSWRPMHPARLREHVGRLGGGPVRGRGHFWLPGRRSVACGWDGAGGQLSVGPLGRWHAPPQTRLVITGTERDPGVLCEAFSEALLSDAELAQGLDEWAGRDDGWDRWLGPRSGATAG